MAPRLTTHVITEKLARQRFNDLLDAENALGSRHPKGRSLYQVVCRGGEWVGLLLWTGALWHLKARDLHLGWDPQIRSERLQLIAHQARFLVPEQAREPNLASACLGASVRDLPVQWEECFGCALALIRTGLQALLRRHVKEPLPVIFENVADDLDLALTWLKQRNFRL